MKKAEIFLLAGGIIVGLAAIFLVYFSFVVRDNVQAGLANRNPNFGMASESLEFHSLARDFGHTFEYIEFPFYGFLEPSFDSEVIALFGPQEIVVVERDGLWMGAWLNDGLLWVHSREIYILEHSTGLFDEPFAESYTYTINPQVLFVQERLGDWTKVGTFAGDKWIYEHFSPSIEYLQELADRFEVAISIFYKNLDTGFIFSHNCDRVYFAASVTKAPFALYIYNLAEQGLTDLSMLITYTQADYWGGSGVIRHRYRIGQQFTQENVLGLNLYESDNIATRMLRRVHGVDGYREFIESIGGNPDFVHNITYSHISAYEAGLWAYRIFEYIESDGQYAQIFKDQLLNNQFKFQRASYPIASKTGWTLHNFGGAWHDMSIIYAPSPYILVILSNSYQPQAFLQLSDAFERFNERYFNNTR